MSKYACYISKNKQVWYPLTQQQRKLTRLARGSRTVLPYIPNHIYDIIKEYLSLKDPKNRDRLLREHSDNCIFQFYAKQLGISIP